MMYDKVGAVYALRAAAEEHGRVEAIVGNMPQGEQLDLLLDTRMRLEELTQAAIEACEHCGLAHVDDQSPCAPSRGQVIKGDFGSEGRADGDGDGNGDSESGSGR